MSTFNSRFVDNYKDLVHSKIGFEFEWYSKHPYVKTLEMLNVEFNPVEVWGFNQYHSAFEVSSKKFKIEPDYSGGSEMIELITGPLEYTEARIILIKALDFIGKNGGTDEHCSIHINISFDDVDVRDLNQVKLILNFNEDFVYEKFPDRRNNIYARSVKWVVPFEDWEDSEAALNAVVQCLQVPDDTKYYGINLQKKWEGYLEYRYIGGVGYEKKADDILSLMDYCVLQTRKAISAELNPEDNIKLLSYLEDNINWFKKYKSYNDFLANIEGIRIEVDELDEYEHICMSWDKLKNKLFEIIKSCDSIKDATINYNTTSNRVEIVNAVMSNIHYLKGVDFVNCQIRDCTLYNCDLIDTRVDGGHIYNTRIYESKLANCKLSNCEALEWSELTDCMFDGGVLDCVMRGGVFRSGQTFENADVDASVKMATKDTFWSIGPQDKMKDIKK